MSKKGYKQTEEHKAKLRKGIKDRIARLGYRYTPEQCKNWSKVMKEKGIKPKNLGWNKGIPNTKKQKEKISASLKAIPIEERPYCFQKGMKPTKEMIEKRVAGFRGKLHYKWIKDRTKLKKYGDDTKDRRSYACGNWTKQVKNRDNWTCRIADNNCEGRLEAHHILNWIEFKELRYDINNGITLCQAHHPRGRAKEKRLSPYFKELVSVSSE